MGTEVVARSAEWHYHETLFGYVAGAIAGFLLTAIPNWNVRRWPEVAKQCEGAL